MILCNLVVNVSEEQDSMKALRAPGGSTAEAVTGRLRAEISSGALAPGTPLRQDELAERFGTSRIPVREALRALQAEGLVDYSANRGANVASISLDDVLELLEVRIALESHALRLAIPKMGDADIDAALRVLKDYDRAPDPADWADMNWQFHSRLYAPCECRRLLQSIEANHGHFSRFTNQQVSTLTGKERPQRDHYGLVKLCAAGKVEPAVALLIEHIRNTQRTMTANARVNQRAR